MFLFVSFALLATHIASSGQALEINKQYLMELDQSMNVSVTYNLVQNQDSVLNQGSVLKSYGVYKFSRDKLDLPVLQNLLSTSPISR